ncbi:MAG: ATP-binding protein [Nitrospira sp.]|nr:ATP-binding protein [Nitrospira sp.]MDH5497314.1 ATP-binding protein [Nitrospira sp.]
MTNDSVQTSHSQAVNRLYQLLTDPGSRYLVLQGLVTIIVSYELLFGVQSIISRGMSNTLVIGFWLALVAIAMLPRTVLASAWFSAGLVTVDTILVTSAIYLSGNARSDLYIAYFVLVLVAASVRRLSHVLGLSLLLSAGYAVVLYEGILQTGATATGQLLGIPVLLVMAVFYGVALENTAIAQEEKASLLKDVEGLKRIEGELSTTKTQLETRIKTIKEDLTRAHAELREGQIVRQGLERRLQEAQKMEAVGRVTARIAGEFGVLFAGIGKQTGIMLSRFQANDPLRSSADEIFKIGEKAATLTAQLIALNLEDRPVCHMVSVHAAIADLQGLMKSLLPSGIELLIRTPKQVVQAEVDREGLETVMFHLVVNARDAMPKGGRLSIDVKILENASQSNLPLPTGMKYPQAVIEIMDTGTGMNLDTQAYMFEPFFSTKETNIGLGLTAVYGIVKQNGGSLDVNSRPGHGTTVRLFFPVASPTGIGDELLSTAMAAKGNETILLVEENEIERKLALSTLQRYRYRVLEAASSVEALMLTQQYDGILHLTVSPLLMPEIGGRELASRLMNQHPKMKALFVSGYDDETIQHHRINQRFVLQHPYRQSGLVEKVREALDAA